MGKRRETSEAGEQDEPVASALSRPAPDWERIEDDYRAGVLSLREIASPYSVTEGAIRKRAKRDGWERDLNAKIHAKAEALVRKAEVRNEVRAAFSPTDKQVIEANAERIAKVRSEHRVDIAKARGLAGTMLDELVAQSSGVEDFAALGEMMRSPDERGSDKLNDIYQKVISLPGRVDSLKKAVETLKISVGMEREAYGLAAADGAPPLSDPAAGMSPNEAARRIAFALHKGLQAKETP